jgi:50S ribosomal protein L16 3-hydroxylase
MRRYWQREPLLLRGAFPAFRDPLSAREVLALAASPEAQSRLVQKRARRWILEHGPFPPSRLKQLPRRDWTVLVQDTNHFSERADRLLSTFDFIPHARIDDVMVSYAVPGGTVGPHVDSYDVFLLQ